MWISPSFEDLKEILSSADQTLLLCSPYISWPGLGATQEALPGTVTHIDVWTKLSTEDWLVGASQPEAILDFIDVAVGEGRSVAVRASPQLHAKIILTDGPKGLAGSSNLTAGGFGGNIEAVRIVDGADLRQLREFADLVRPKLEPITLDQFRNFVGRCLAKIDSQEAMLELIRTEIPPPNIGPEPLIPYSDYLSWLEASSNELDQELYVIAKNIDQNNNTGKVKHAFYGVQRFLQEYPQHTDYVGGLPESDWFDVSHSSINNDWRRFLIDYQAEVSAGYQYSIRTLVSYLTPTSGGRRTGGGGGDNELKRVWPSVGRIVLASRQG